jgi:2-dehydro-3-deoxygluconokinase
MAAGKKWHVCSVCEPPEGLQGLGLSGRLPMGVPVDVLTLLGERRLLAIVRGRHRESALETVLTLAREGVDLIEVSLTSEKALDVISAARAALGPGTVLGAGTVVTARDARDAQAAGADFAVTPGLCVGAEEARGLGETMVSFIPADGAALDDAGSVALEVAGAESNVAMYLADHGIDARWVSRLGDDAFGRRVLRHVRAAGVDVSGVRTDPARPTGLLFKDPAQNGSTRVSYYRHGSAASAMGPDVLDDEAMRTADLWHLTGITPALSASCHDLVRAALSGDRPTVSFDVNYRPALWHEAPGELLREFAQAAGIVFVGLDEARALWGDNLHDHNDVRSLLPAPRILVVKDGPRSATAFHGDASTQVPSLAVDVVEPVGAGDAFAAGFLAGLLRGEPMERCLRLGHVTAASALSVIGDHGPLLGGYDVRATPQ